MREDDLRSGSRRREVIEVRKLFCQLALRKMGYCGGDVERFFGVTTPAVNKAANSEEVAGYNFSMTIQSVMGVTSYRKLLLRLIQGRRAFALIFVQAIQGCSHVLLVAH